MYWSLCIFRSSDANAEDDVKAERPVPASLALNLCSDLALKYLEKKEESFPNFLHRHRHYLIYGTSYINDQ